MENVGSRIKSFRQAKKWSQRDLAEAVGLSQQRISQIENGDTIPPLVLPHIATSLGCPIYDLDPDYLETYVDQISAFKSYAIETINKHGTHGFGEPEVSSFAAMSQASPEDPDTTEAVKHFLSAARAMIPGAGHLSAMRVERDTPSLRLLAGDIIAVDLKPGPLPVRSVVVLQAETEVSGEYITLLREYFPDFFLSRDDGAAAPVIHKDDERVVILAQMVAVFRADLRINR